MIGWNIFISVLLLFWLIGMTSATFVFRHSPNNTQPIAYLRILLWKFYILKPTKQNASKMLTNKQLKKIRRKELLKRIKQEQKRRKKEQKKQNKNANKPTTSAAPKKKISDYVSLFSELVNPLAKVITVFSSHLKVKTVRLIIIVASQDAAKTAILCGALSQSVDYVTELLTNFTNYKFSKKDKIGVYPDFLSEKTVFDIDISLKIRVWHILDALFKGVMTYVRAKVNSKINNVSQNTQKNIANNINNGGKK